METAGRHQGKQRLDGCATEVRAGLVGQGFSRRAVNTHLQLLRQLNGWLVGEGLDPAALTAPVIAEFLRVRRAQGQRHVTRRALAPLLGQLRELGVVPEEAVVAPVSPVEVVLEQYCTYLAEQRGLTPVTIGNYLPYARQFLAGASEPIEAGLAGLTPAQVSVFVLAESKRREIGACKVMVTALRSLLRFLHATGRAPARLASAVPSVASWKLSSLPNGLGNQQITALQEGCDRSTAIGRRDYAVLLLLARLGLRAGEVVALEIGDVDWRAGTLAVRGKGRKAEQLPLPADVGEALADYVMRGRPNRGCEKLFIRTRAPWTGLSNSAVWKIAAAAGSRAGLTGVGAHRLRHSAATTMLAGGASLTEIAQVLRHNTLRTTALYAKVDLAALSALARPWPAGAA